ncbi:MAG: formate dehydrogenase accessory protein FdhE [Vicinamibacterales bacterium]
MAELRASLDRRLAEISAARPELERALELQRTLLSRQIDMLDVFRSGGIPSVSLPPRYLAAKLRTSVPALHGEPIPLPSKLLELSAREYCAHLAGSGAGEAAAAIGRAFEAGTLDAAAVISACFGRDQRRVRFMTAQQGLSPDIAWLVAEMALAPFAHLLQCRALATAHTTGSVRAWDRGYCPACGSWPAIAEAVAGRHTLRCSFCAAGWELSSYRCLYCSNDGETFLTGAPDPKQPWRRLQMCGACGGYVKVLELVTPTEFPLVAVEDLASMDLDLTAIERKYIRPPLPEIRKR